MEALAPVSVECEYGASCRSEKRAGWYSLTESLATDGDLFAVGLERDTITDLLEVVGVGDDFVSGNGILMKIDQLEATCLCLGLRIC